MLTRLGILAGKGELPGELAAIYNKHQGICFIAIISDSYDSSLTEYPHKNFPLGQVGNILEFFKENGVKEIVIIGNIDRPDLKSLKVDFTGTKLLARILKNQLLGDDKILTIITEFIEEHGFKVISPNQILSLKNNEVDSETEAKPSKTQIDDIKLGKTVLNALGTLDVGQAIIVDHGYVLGIEAAEGTDNLIRRCELLRKTDNGGVLVKMAKSSQDKRLDIPTIGPETIFCLAKHNFAGVAIERNGVLIARKSETFALADKCGLFIHFI